jgi:hypothetical protein
VASTAVDGREAEIAEVFYLVPSTFSLWLKRISLNAPPLSPSRYAYHRPHGSLGHQASN